VMACPPPVQGRGWGWGMSKWGECPDRPHPNPSPEGEGLSVARYSNFPPGMDRHQPAHDRFYFAAREAGAADHRLEFRHRREAADRFDQVAVAVGIAGDRLAELRHQLVRIDIVGSLEA